MEKRGRLGHCCELLRLSLFLLAQGLNSRLWSTSGHWCPFLGRRAIKCQRSPTSCVYAFMGCLARIARSLLTPMKTKEVTSSPLTTMETVSLIIFQEYDETGQAKRVKIGLTSRSDQATQHSPQKLNLAPTPSKVIGQGCTICIRRQSSPNKVAPSFDWKCTHLLPSYEVSHDEPCSHRKRQKSSCFHICQGASQHVQVIDGEISQRIRGSTGEWEGLWLWSEATTIQRPDV